MRGDILMGMPVLFPVLCGWMLFALKKHFTDKEILITTGIVTVINTGMAYFVIKQDASCTLFHLTKDLSIGFHCDKMSLFFIFLMSFIWIAVAFYSVAYMEEENHIRRFSCFYLIVMGVLNGLYLSQNLITMYVFYELMTLSSFPLVMHEETHEAVIAGLKYLFYSFFGAFFALIGIFYLYHLGISYEFHAGGVSGILEFSEKEPMVLIVLFMMLLGFSVKAGLMPFHGWLTLAHPAAPAPASAALSSIIAKSGVFAIIRVIFYIYGWKALSGTWVQTVFLWLIVLTIFSGSMLAYRSNGLKKRLAYSTISQISYILLGIFTLTPWAMEGAFLHIIFHAVSKCILFLGAGSMIHYTGYKKVDELYGIGRKMPGILGCFAIASLSLVGIPPFHGFVSKWILAMGVMNAEIPVFSYLGPAILLVSAFLTAGYLFTIVIRGFFGEEEEYGAFQKILVSKWMLVPLCLLAFSCLILGLFTKTLTDFTEAWIATLL